MNYFEARRTARQAGIWYLIVALSGMYAQFAVRMKSLIPADAQATAENILALGSQYRWGIFSDLVMVAAFLMLVIKLQKLFAQGSLFHSRLMVYSVLISIAMMSLNLIHQYAAYAVLSGPIDMASLGSEFQYTQATFYLHLHDQGYLLAQLFFGIWLFPLGKLGVETGAFPKWLGRLLQVSCFAYLLDLTFIYVAPDFQGKAAPFVLAFPLVGEFSTIFWLLIKGVKKGEAVTT